MFMLCDMMFISHNIRDLNRYNINNRKWTLTKV